MRETWRTERGLYLVVTPEVPCITVARNYYYYIRQQSIVVVVNATNIGPN